jgi:hypothetical protein
MTSRKIAQLPPVGVSNRFSGSAKDAVPTRELTLTLNSDTGLLSLGNTFTSRELRHSHEWLKYQEPESHCLALGEEVLKLAKIPYGQGVAGLSWKDAGLMDSCARFGHITTILYPRARHWGSSPELDTWERDSIDVQESISNHDSGVSGPQFSFLSARHLLEHAVSIEKFMAGLAKKVSPDGYVLLEVPDCEEAIASCDYSMIWEEHIHYFTADSLERTLQKLGWRVVKLSREIVEEEAVLIAIVQLPLETSQPVPTPESPRSNIDAVRFGENFEKRRMKIMTYLIEKQRSGSSLYVLGANHVASNFLDLFGDEGLFVGCLDDNPEKQGRFISAKSVPILPLEELSWEKDTFVLSVIHPSRAEAVERKLNVYQELRLVIHRVSILIPSI